MKIIIEGPDGAGKTTLARELGEHLKWPVQHLTGSDDKVFMRNQFMNASVRNNVILDRYIISNLAYSYVFNGVRISDDVLSAMLGSQLGNPSKQECDLYIFCLPGLRARYCNGVDAYKAVFKDLVGRREEMFTDVDKMCKVWEYMSVAADILGVNGNVWTFDYTNDNNKLLMYQVVKRVKEAQA